MITKKQMIEAQILIEQYNYEQRTINLNNQLATENAKGV